MSLTGLNEADFSTISVSNQIRLGISANNGDDGQFVKSDGENASWSDISSTDVLQAGVGININTATDPDTISTNVKSLVLDGTAVQGTEVQRTFNPNADGGSQTITINDTDTTYQGSATIDIDTSTNPDQISCLKVPNALTQGTNITFSSGTTYDGSSAITISSTDTDTTYQGSATISINTATTPDTISCLKVPQTLSAGSNIRMEASGVETGSYDGSVAKTISVEYLPSSTITIDTSTAPDTLRCAKVPNSLTAGTNISFTDGGGGAQTTYDGSQGITISASGGGGGGGADVSQIDHTTDGNYYLPFFASDGFTYPFGGPTLHPNEINDTKVPQIDGFLTMTAGDSVVFTKKIPVGWRGVEINFGLFNDDPSGSGFILAPGGQARVNIKKRLLANDTPTIIPFPPNTPFDISSTPLVNDFEEMVVVELIDPEGAHLKAYTGGGWIRIEPVP